MDGVLGHAFSANGPGWAGTRWAGGRWLGPRRLGALGVATGATVVAEILWAAFRPLPHLDELDASGLLPTGGDGDPIRVAVLGDSTLTGPGLAGPEEIWVRRALEALDLGRPIDLRSFAVGGSRVADVRRRLPEALAFAPHVAVVAVGSNDAIHGTAAGPFARDFDAMLTDLRRHVDVVAVTNVGDLGNIVRFAAPLRQLMAARGRRFCRTIERIVARHEGTILLDVTPANRRFRDRGLFAPDLFHPNGTGHHVWAATLTPGLHAAVARAR